jgi:type II secretory pathway pseudopilin PulG
MIVGIMLGMTGQSWKMIMKREREKELLFRGSQIKEAIENWYNPNYSVQGVKWNAAHPLTDLKDLLQNPYTLTPLRYLPQSYDAKVDDKNPRCGSDCARLKIYQDPMTGKEWTLIKCDISTNTHPFCMGSANPNKIIGVASKSDEEPLRTKESFKGTALENMGDAGSTAAVVTLPMGSPFIGGGTATPVSGAGNKMTKYSEWKFIADKQNDHTKIYKAYHEGW